MLEQTLIVNGQPSRSSAWRRAGFEGTTLGAQPQVFVPITHARRDAPGLQGLRRSRTHLLGVSVRAAQAGRDGRAGRAALERPYTPIINDVEAPLQKGMSEQTMARFTAKTDRW